MRRKHSLETKARLLEAAQHCLLERGFDATVKDIAARAGVAKGTFYLYFANKEACCRSTIDSFLVRLAQVLERPAQDGRPSMAALYTSWLEQNERFLSFCWSNRAMLRLLLGRSGGSAYDHVLEEFAARTTSAAETFARELIAEGIYRHQGDPQLVACLVSGAYERLVRQLIQQSAPPDLWVWSQTALETITLGLLDQAARHSIETSVPASPPRQARSS